MMKRCSVLFLLLVMTVSLLFAGGAQESTGKTETTLQVFSMPTNGSGIQSDPLAQYMADELGLVIDWLPAAGETSNQKLQAMMAAGDLPDLICFLNFNQAQEAVDAGLLIPLDEHLDKMPNLAKNAGKSLDYFADTLGDGTAYFVGQGINNAVFNGNANWAINLRWDLYKKIGMPPINTMDDLVDILGQMQALEPTGRRPMVFRCVRIGRGTPSSWQVSTTPSMGQRPGMPMPSTMQLQARSSTSSLMRATTRRASSSSSSSTRQVCSTQTP